MLTAAIGSRAPPGTVTSNVYELAVLTMVSSSRTA